MRLSREEKVSFVQFCLNISSHAGLTSGSVCVCGDTLTEATVSEAFCDQPCSGSPSQMCGSARHLNVYHITTVPLTGLTIEDPGTETLKEFLMNQISLSILVFFYLLSNK